MFFFGLRQNGYFVHFGAAAPEGQTVLSPVDVCSRLEAARTFKGAGYEKYVEFANI